VVIRYGMGLGKERVALCVNHFVGVFTSYSYALTNITMSLVGEKQKQNKKGLSYVFVTIISL